VLGGQSRSRWQHSIPATKGLRYSVTLRMVRGPERPDRAGGAGLSEPGADPAGAVPDSSGQER
jgi:hypothetical protein